MRTRSRVYLGASLVLVLVLAACSGGGESAQLPTTSDTPASDASSAARARSSASVIAPRGTVGAVAAQSTTTSEGSGVTTSSGGLNLNIATPPGNRPVVKNVPTQPPRSNAAIGEPHLRSTFDANGDGFFTWAELQQAVTALYSTYKWPPSYRVDPSTLTSGYAAYASKGRFEVGAAYTLIGIPHMCAWEKTWLDGYAAGDNNLMQESMDQLQSVTLNNPMFAPIRDHLKEMYQRAELGDPALIQQDVDSTCGSVTFITPAPATPGES